MMRQQLYSTIYFIDALAALDSKLTLSHVFLECLYLWLCAFLRIGLRMSLPSTDFCNVLLDDYTYAPTTIHMLTDANTKDHTVEDQNINARNLQGHGTIEAVSTVSRHAYTATY